MLHFLIPFYGHWDLPPPEEAAALPQGPGASSSACVYTAPSKRVQGGILLWIPSFQGLLASPKISALKSRTQTKQLWHSSSVIHTSCTSQEPQQAATGPWALAAWEDLEGWVASQDLCIVLIRGLRFQQEPAHIFPIQVLEWFQLITWNQWIM